jgi:hypothetical protein
MTPVQRFEAVLAGRVPGEIPFFPDISTWYQTSRLGLGAEQPFFPGQYIPDGDPIHKYASRLEGALASLSYVDIYREFGWGLPAHIYDWCDELFAPGATKTVVTEGRHRTLRFSCPAGDLTRTYKLDAEGTWSEYGHMVKDLGDLDVVRSLVRHTRREAHPERIERFLRETEGFGVCDIVVFRSPFGKLVHEYLGFENLVYALEDHEKSILDFIEFQTEVDLRFMELAASMPGGVVIISDHADENLISPPWYRRFCMPFYREACAILHGAGKLVSTHLDGNIKGYLSFLSETGFDILDGCTPAPMFNYEVEELAAATRRGAAPGSEGAGKAIGSPMSCWCGVPAGLFTFGYPRDKIADFGERISGAFGGRVIVNVGDILPPTGDIGAVIELGKRMAALPARASPAASLSPRDA